MVYRVLVCGMLGVIAVSQTWLPRSGLAEPSIVQLITVEEAEQRDATDKKGFFASRKEANEGPAIQINKPTPDSEVMRPVAIHIAFKENLAPVDVGSLEVTYLKLVSIDITDRIKPYVTERGISLAAADLPAGTHRVRFGIRDIEDRLTERTLKLTVLDESHG